MGIRNIIKAFLLTLLLTLGSYSSSSGQSGTTRVTTGAPEATSPASKAADIECPTKNDFSCNCQTGTDGAVACEPSLDKIGAWTHSGAVGTKGDIANDPTLDGCADPSAVDNTTYRLTCCYAACDVFSKTVTAASCTKTDADSFNCI
jgi:hypothetical protein